MKNISQKIKILFVAIVVSSFAQAENPKSVYVQSVTAKITSEKKMGSLGIATVKRGQVLNISEVDSNWYKVKYNGKEGWISKLFVSDTKPVGAADVSDNEKISPEKLSRKRSNNYSTSAATRGLSMSERGRGNTEKFRTNTQAVEKIENENLKTEEIQKFEDEAHLNKD